MNNELVQLITDLGETRDKSGFLNGNDEKVVEIFAGIKSVNRSEYYEALRANLEVTKIFVVDPDDFELSAAEVEIDGRTRTIRASFIEYEGVRYRIQRQYLVPTTGRLELTCAEVEAYGSV